MGKRGLGLGTTLVVVALVATLGLLVSSASVTHLQVTARATNEALATDLARSALNLAVEKVFSNKDFGTRPEQDSTLDIQLTGYPEGSQGLLTFQGSRADELGIPVSTNNLLGKGSTDGAGGQVVPSQSVHFVAVGRCRGVTHTAEAILHLPPFPYALASDGCIKSAGDLVVGAVDQDTPPESPVEQLKPATLLSNGQGLSIDLGPNSKIQGDLLAAGGIQIDPNGSQIFGQQLTNQAARKVPKLDLPSFDPVAAGRPYSTPPLESGSTTLTGSLRQQGFMKVTGDLALNGAVLFVEGDLEVTGSLSGTGIVVTTGTLTVNRQTQMSSSDKLALVSGGNMTLLGQGEEASSVRGVIYTEGGLVAHRLTVQGALLARQKDPLTQGVDVQQMRLLKDPDARVSVSVTTSYSGPQIASSFTVAQGRIGVQDGRSYAAVRLENTGHGTVSYYCSICANGGFAGSELERNEQPDVRELAEFIIDNTQNNPPDRDQAVEALRQELANQVSADWLVTGGPTPGSSVTSLVTVDPSELYPLAEQARVVLWRDR